MCFITLNTRILDKADYSKLRHSSVFSSLFSGETQRRALSMGKITTI